MLDQSSGRGGLPILTDSAREADTDNPRGYLALKPAKRPDMVSGWLADARGRAVKIVAQLLPALTAKHRYRIIFVERPLNEIIASQRAMLERTGRPGGKLADHPLAETFPRQINRVRQIIVHQQDRAVVLSASYHEALSDPAAVAARINAFSRRHAR